MTARSSFIYQPPLYIIVTSTWQERHSDKKNGQIWLVRCNWETMVQFMEAAKRAIATGLPSKMRVGQVRRTGNMRVLDENEKGGMGVMQ